jgi:hypothetical protein
MTTLVSIPSRRLTAGTYETPIVDLPAGATRLGYVIDRQGLRTVSGPAATITLLLSRSGGPFEPVASFGITGGVDIDEETGAEQMETAGSLQLFGDPQEARQVMARLVVAQTFRAGYFVEAT